MAIKQQHHQKRERGAREREGGRGRKREGKRGGEGGKHLVASTRGAGHTHTHTHTHKPRPVPAHPRV